MTSTALKDRGEKGLTWQTTKKITQHTIFLQDACVTRNGSLLASQLQTNPAEEGLCLQPGLEGSAVGAWGSTAETGVLRGNWSTLLIPEGRWVEFKEVEASPGLAAAQMCWRMLGQVPAVLTVSLITSDSNVKASWDMLPHRASSHHSHD